MKSPALIKRIRGFLKRSFNGLKTIRRNGFF